MPDEQSAIAGSDRNASAELFVLRVFANDTGKWGNRLGVFMEGAKIPQAVRQQVARGLSFSESVFVEWKGRYRIQIFTPAARLPFAGHPTLGTSWLLTQLGHRCDVLETDAGPVVTWTDPDGLRWIRADPSYCPPWQHVQLPSADAVKELKGPPLGMDFVQLWAWVDRTEGVIQARVFAPRVGVAEDEACGSASMLLGQAIGKPLVVRHGGGSLIHVRPAPNGAIDLGGRVVFDVVMLTRLPSRTSA